MRDSRILYITIMGSADVVRPGLFVGNPDGEHDAAWLCRRLAEAGLPALPWIEQVDVCTGTELPPVEDFDAVVVGGSYHNVDEGHDWQLRTMEWLRSWRDTGRPMLGICGGHQMAAVLLGGRVTRMAVGPWALTAPVRLTDDGRRHYLFEGLPGEVQVHLGHYDHVEELPAGATVLAMRDGVVQALDFGGGWLGLQFHPEISGPTMVHAWDGVLGDIADAYRDTPDGGRVLVNFLRAHGLLPESIDDRVTPDAQSETPQADLAGGG